MPRGVSAPHNPLMDKGTQALSQHDDEALDLWKVKGPKQHSGSAIKGVLFHGETVLMLQRPNGKYTLYRRFDLEPEGDD